MEKISANLKEVKKEIAETCLKVKRAPSEVRLLAVSKTLPIEAIKSAYAYGQRLFGENRVQELNRKQPVLPAEIEWHFIGTLQRNKVKNLVGRVSLIHSVDSFTLAQEISRQAVNNNLTINILLQVNIAAEVSKHGFTIQAVKEEITDISKLPGIRIKGLMTMAPLTGDPEEVRPIFRQLKALALELKALEIPEVEMSELSMGMSEDFKVAIEEGATLVRIGSRIWEEESM